MQVNPNNSLTERVNIFIIQIEYTAKKKKLVKLWVSRSYGVMTVVCWIYTTAVDDDVKMVVSSQPSSTWDKSANKKIGICTLYE